MADPIKKPTVEELQAQLDAALKEIETLKASQAKITADEVKIREKMAHGLTRDQAISVIRRQREHDEAEAAAAEKKKAATAAQKPAEKK